MPLVVHFSSQPTLTPVYIHAHTHTCCLCTWTPHVHTHTHAHPCTHARNRRRLPGKPLCFEPNAKANSDPKPFVSLTLLQPASSRHPGSRGVFCAGMPCSVTDRNLLSREAQPVCQHQTSGVFLSSKSCWNLKTLKCSAKRGSCSSVHGLPTSKGKQLMIRSGNTDVKLMLHSVINIAGGAD